MKKDKQDNPLEESTQANSEATNMHKQISCEHIQKISKSEKFYSVLNYYWHDRKPAIITVLLVILSVILFISISKNYTISKLFNAYLKEDQLLTAIIQLTTFLAIISIWYRNIRKEWRQKLNKFLTVSFVHDGKLKIQCRYAKLSSEADARGMAQSFAQILNCGRLDFAPSLQEITEAIKIDKNKKVDNDCCFLINRGEPFLHLDVVIHLIEDIEALCEGKDKEITITKGQYLQWDYPFEEDKKRIKELT